jgi:hypothetical protein
MASNEMAYYPLQQIRKISNIPLELFGMTMSEIQLLVQITGLSYVGGIMLQVVLNIIFDNPGAHMYDLLIFVPFMIYVIRYINDHYGKGLIFFIVASFKAKDFPQFSKNSILKNKNL